MKAGSSMIATNLLCASVEPWFWSVKTTDEWFKRLTTLLLTIWG